MTQTPASGPDGPVTTPPTSSLSIGIAPPAWRAPTTASDAANIPATLTVTIPQLRRLDVIRFLLQLIASCTGTPRHAVCAVQRRGVLLMSGSVLPVNTGSQGQPRAGGG